MKKKLLQNQKISSDLFDSDGSWYLDFYPKGYMADKFSSGDYEWLSIYLHSSRSALPPHAFLKAHQERPDATARIKVSR